MELEHLKKIISVRNQLDFEVGVLTKIIEEAKPPSRPLTKDQAREKAFLDADIARLDFLSASGILKRKMSLAKEYNLTKALREKYPDLVELMEGITNNNTNDSQG